jgi:hypothetical protein
MVMALQNLKKIKKINQISKDNGKKDYSLKEFLILVMVEFIVDNSKKVRCMEKEY